MDEYARISDHWHRLVRVVRGEMEFTLECEPRFDYGREEHDGDMAEHGAVFRSGSLDLSLHSTIQLNRRCEGGFRGGRTDVSQIVLEAA